MKVKIIGAGMAGLLAGNVLRRFKPTIIDQQQGLPHNHSALLRFRTTEVSDATGIPFQKVTVNKGIWDGKTVHNQCTIPLANAYSSNAVGVIERRSIWNMGESTRYISPADFIEQMSQAIDVQLGTPFSKIDHGRGSEDELAISTLPMPVMMKLFEYPDPPPVFSSQPVVTLCARLMFPAADVHQTIYNSSSDPTWYRATIQGDLIIIEGKEDALSYWKGRIEPVIKSILEIFGIQHQESSLLDIRVNSMKTGKIVPISEDIRKRFICWLTDEYGIFSLGRFATWRPLLLDDLVKDVKQIERLFSQGIYQRRLK